MKLNKPREASRPPPPDLAIYLRHLESERMLSALTLENYQRDLLRLVENLREAGKPCQMQAVVADAF